MYCCVATDSACIALLLLAQHVLFFNLLTQYVLRCLYLLHMYSLVTANATCSTIDEPTICNIRGEHTNHYTIDEHMICHTRGEHANHYTTDEPTICYTRGEHANHYTIDAVQLYNGIPFLAMLVFIWLICVDSTTAHKTTTCTISNILFVFYIFESF